MHLHVVSPSDLGFNGNTGTGTIYTSTLDLQRCAGSMGILLSSLTTSDVLITQQCSFNGEDWYTPYSTAAVTANAVYWLNDVTTHGVYITLTPAVTKFWRLSVVISTASNVTLQVAYQDERN